jgi:hypothetical protein
VPGKTACVVRDTVVAEEFAIAERRAGGKKSGLQESPETPGAQLIDSERMEDERKIASVSELQAANDMRHAAMRRGTEKHSKFQGRSPCDGEWANLPGLDRMVWSWGRV